MGKSNSRIAATSRGMWYGRRYYFQVKDFLTDISSDVLHFCIIRGDKRHPENAGRYPGCQYGWPLSIGERALVLRFVKSDDAQAAAAQAAALLELYEYV